MDKKNLILGIALICGAFASLYVGQQFSPKPAAAPAAVRDAVAQQQANAPVDPAVAAQPPALAAGGQQATFASATGDNKNARVTTLENDFVSVRFTGQMIEDVGAAATPFDEVWHLVKPKDDSRNWAIAGIQQQA